MKEGKSAFLPFFGGSGQEQARKMLEKLSKDPLTGTALLPCPGANQTDDSMVYLRIVGQYSHMGVKTMASGSVVPELQSRHSTTVPYVDRLTWQFFKKTTTAVEKKIAVATSVLLSKETYAVGCMPVLNTSERQTLHKIIVGVYRRATQTCVSIDADLNHGVSDAVLLHSFGFRAPYIFVRFHRLRLSVRFFSKAPFQLVVLACTAALDSRSWMHALMLGLKWLFAVDSKICFDVNDWYHFVRSEPKRARNIIRKACSSDAARSLTLMETSSAVATLCEYHTCHCGRSFPSKPALDAPGVSVRLQTFAWRAWWSLAMECSLRVPCDIDRGTCAFCNA